MPPKPKSVKKNDASTKATKTNETDAALLKARVPPNWPPIASLIPAEDLYLETLLEDQILTISKFWTSSLCKTYVNFLSTLPFATTPSKPKRGEAVRVNDRFQLDDPDFAEQLWSRTALKQIVEHPVLEGKELTP